MGDIFEKSVKNIFMYNIVKFQKNGLRLCLEHSLLCTQHEILYKRERVENHANFENLYQRDKYGELTYKVH